MAEETAIDIQDIKDSAFSLEKTLEKIKNSNRDYLIQDDEKEINLNLRMIIWLSRKMLKDLSKNRLIPDSVKNLRVAKAVDCRDIGIGMRSKTDSLYVLKGKKFTAQINSLIKDCKEIRLAVLPAIST